MCLKGFLKGRKRKRDNTFVLPLILNVQDYWPQESDVAQAEHPSSNSNEQ
jgi:hypothetical protein